MVAERRDPRMVSASGKTCADAAQCGISHRMEHHLPLHGPLRRTGSDLRLALAPEDYGAMVRTAGIQRAVEHPLLRMPKLISFYLTSLLINQSHSYPFLSTLRIKNNSA